MLPPIIPPMALAEARPLEFFDHWSVEHEIERRSENAKEDGIDRVGHRRECAPEDLRYNKPMPEAERGRAAQDPQRDFNFEAEMA